MGYIRVTCVPASLAGCRCSKIAEAEAAVSVNEKNWLVMHMHVQLKLDELRGPPNPWLTVTCPCRGRMPLLLCAPLQIAVPGTVACNLSPSALSLMDLKITPGAQPASFEPGRDLCSRGPHPSHDKLFSLCAAFP